VIEGGKEKMCYSNCPYEDSSGMCRLRYPKCEYDPSDSEEYNESLKDKLWDDYEDSERTYSSLKSAYQILKK